MSSYVDMTLNAKIGRPLDLDAVDEALNLEAPPRTQQPQESAYDKIGNIGREFIRLTNDNWNTYHRLRGLIQNDTYWMLEEAHWAGIMDIIELWNDHRGNNMKSLKVPPLDVLETRLRTRHQYDKESEIYVEERLRQGAKEAEERKREQDRKRKAAEKAELDNMRAPVASRTRSRSNPKTLLKHRATREVRRNAATTTPSARRRRKKRA